MTKQDQRIEKAMLAAYTAHKKKEWLHRNIASEYNRLARHHIVWIRELTQRYMLRGDFPLTPWTILPQIYSEPRDKEIVAMLCPLVKEGPDIVNHVHAIRTMLGEHPWQWFKQRGFVFFGDDMNAKTGGVPNWQIANLFERIWREGDGMMPSVEAVVMRLMHDCHFSADEALLWLYDESKKVDTLKEIRLLWLVLSSFDGFGQSVWNNVPFNPRCPLTNDVLAFLGIWLQDYKLMGGADRAIEALGFDQPYHFYYSCLAFRELEEYYPEECARYLKTYSAWVWRNKPRDHLCEWKKIFPPLDFCSP